jgi:hypothetical protein
VSKALFVLAALFCAGGLRSEELRSFDDVFVRTRGDIVAEAKIGDGFSGIGYSTEGLSYRPALDCPLDFRDLIDIENTNHVIENLVLIPYSNESPQGAISKLDLYNIVNNVTELGSFAYYNEDGSRKISLLTEAYMVAEPGSKRPLPLPPPAEKIADRDTFYVRARGVNLKWTYCGVSTVDTEHALLVSVTNERAVFYSIFPVLGRRRAQVYFYIEPVAEGVALQSLCAFESPIFLDSLFNIPAAIRRRVNIALRWFRTKV